jgi:hypothetical protein
VREDFMPNPLVVIRDLVAADAANLPTGTTRGTTAPTALAAPYVQYAWDGTPSDADNRENVAVRVTVWTPKGQTTTAQDIALGLRYRLLKTAEHSDAWRIDRGAGRLPGVDPDTGLPFCTFSLNVALHAPA